MGSVWVSVSVSVWVLVSVWVAFSGCYRVSIYSVWLDYSNFGTSGSGAGEVGGKSSDMMSWVCRLLFLRIEVGDGDIIGAVDSFSFI